MKAVVLAERGIKGPEVQDIQPPQRPEGCVLVKMQAASLNRVDVYMRDNGAGITHSLPQIMGVDGIGEIFEVGEGSDYSVGEKVVIYPYLFCQKCEYCLDGNQPLCVNAKIYGEHIDGTFAEIVPVPEVSLARLNQDADPVKAATLGVTYLTAWRMMFGKVWLQPGQTILVAGAGGGVGAACVQLGHLAGLNVIATTTGNKQEKLKEIGADYVIDYKEEKVTERVLEITNKRGVDLAIDCVGEASWSDTLKSLSRGGHVATCGATTGAHPSADLQRMFIRQLNVHGSTMASIKEFNHLISTYNHGHLDPLIDSVFEVDNVHKAFERLEHPERIGKVVLTFQ